MKNVPRLFLSGFADEASQTKLVTEQFATFAAIGLQYYSIRFVNLGDGVKNVMKLTKGDIQHVRQLQNEYGINVSSLGSPIGKVKLRDVDDGTNNVYTPFSRYLEHDVRQACELAHALETKLIRGFSFYPPQGEDPADYIEQAADQLGKIAEMCHRSDLTFGLEVEANLVGRSGTLVADLFRRVNHPAMLLIFDGANIVMQGYNAAEVYEQYEAMKPGLGWLHLKDYAAAATSTTHKKGGNVAEDKMAGFTTCDRGDSAYERIFRDLVTFLPALEQKLKKRGLPGVFVDLEPHLKGGGQFGGYSGADGLGVACRALCKMLDGVGISYHLRDFDDIRAARGF
ncbi:MAG: sugar phosphate isomerase/epimerase family protein [Thermoguttaceae bacterium]